MSTRRVSVVIPTWNGAGLLDAALCSLDHQTFRDFEVIVVDNGSTDGTRDMLRTRHPSVRVESLPGNAGFAAAVNRGIEAAAGDIVVLMNNDVEAEQDWLAELLSALERYPAAGACASRMVLHSDPTVLDSAGDAMGLFATSIGHRQPDGDEWRREGYVLSACAGAAAYRRKALAEVGNLDEKFFAYLEDVDLGLRLQLAGWECVYVPAAVVRHHGSATANRMPARKLFLVMRNSLFLFFQYMPLRVVIGAGIPMLFWPVYRVIRDDQPLRLAFQSIAAFLRKLPSVMVRRRHIAQTRRITTGELMDRLSGWPGRGAAVRAIPPTDVIQAAP